MKVHLSDTIGRKPKEVSEASGLATVVRVPVRAEQSTDQGIIAGIRPPAPSKITEEI
jgi:hypothetical protein